MNPIKERLYKGDEIRQWGWLERGERNKGEEGRKRMKGRVSAGLDIIGIMEIGLLRLRLKQQLVGL